jgi:hypothetical protein
MRIALVVLFVMLSTAPEAAAAEPPLVGTSGSGPVRWLDRDLKPIAGTPRLSRETAGIVRSPDAKRLATWRLGADGISVRHARTGTVLRQLKAVNPGGIEVFWPARDHIVTVVDERGRRPVVVRSYDLENGSVRVKRLSGVRFFRYVEKVGRVIRVITTNGSVGNRTGFTLHDFAPDGRRLRTEPVALPDGMDGDALVQLSGDRLLVSQHGLRVLVDLESGATTPLVPSSNGLYWLGENLVQDGSQVAQINRDTGALGKRVTLVDPWQELTATPDGGFIVGIGQARYDADLELVAEHPVAPDTSTSRLVLAGSRFYAMYGECANLKASVRLVIGSTRTGQILNERPGFRWRLGRLGDGVLPISQLDIDC